MNAFLAQTFALARRSPLAAVCLCLLLVLGTADFFLWRESQKEARRAERARQEGEAMLLSLSNQPRLEANQAVAREALKAIGDSLISEADLAGNLDYFYQIEKSTRNRLISISQLSTPSGAAETAYRAVPFTLRLAGNYQQLLAFVHALETGPRLLRVRNYRFAQSDPSLDSLSLDLTVEILGRP